MLEKTQNDLSNKVEVPDMATVISFPSVHSKILKILHAGTKQLSVYTRAHIIIGQYIS
jgi:hypothetical protein